MVYDYAPIIRREAQQRREFWLVAEFVTVFIAILIFLAAL